MMKFNNINNKYVKRRIKVGKFIEGSYFPSYDGASSKFSNIPKFIRKEGVNMIMFHCFRGWSDLEQIKNLPFTTYVFSPETFYKRHDVILKILKKEKIEVLEFNDIETIINVGSFLSYELKLPISYDVHIISSEISRLLSTRSEYLRVKKLETELKHFISSACCLTTSDKNKLINITSINKERVFMIPMGVDVDYIKSKKSFLKSNVILFLGNLFYEPNAQAVKILATDIYQVLKNLNTNIEFIIAGDAPSSIIKKYQKIDFKFIGRVHDLNEIFEITKIAVVPLAIGGGIRVKVLHYMAAGIPTILSSTAAEGIISNDNLIIEDDFSKYPDLIINLINDENLLKQKSQGLRKAAEKYYSWSIVSKKLPEYYQYSLNNNLPINIRNLKKNSFIQPSWLKETITKKRFKEANKIDNNQYLKLGNRKKEISYF